MSEIPENYGLTQRMIPQPTDIQVRLVIKRNLNGALIKQVRIESSEGVSFLLSFDGVKKLRSAMDKFYTTPMRGLKEDDEFLLWSSWED